ncbi:hypothetical protein BUALT_Bualt04G0137600 [Buddleja alternifolia]|uniref:UDP-glycosyltransferase n=1 Tax=Buddleja alternifolia TaxID=168488 RepID=A0AAV6XV64_9LAMI|nr:hypothetical protein BUALT_Bualt04G0137600 [Buddleja alternifolia]
MGKPHVMAIPYPAQGHVIPLMEVAQCLANNGVKVTFVNTEFNHKRVVEAISQTGGVHELISLVSVQDVMESWEDRNDHGKLADAMINIMPQRLQNLIEKINGTESDEITCVITDIYMAGAMDVAEKLGTPLKNQLIQLSPSMPEMSTQNFAWSCFPDLTMQKLIFQAILVNNKLAELAQYLICNSSHDLEPGALDFLPNSLPIGPLLASNRLGKPSGHFWPEDSSCLEWLDQQPISSVIYVAFGSFTVFNEVQFQELASGLELTNRPFLWVVRQDITQDIDEAYPVGFKERVKNRAKMVDWAPQQQVLSHPSIACFLTHCGWNSTTEGVSNAVPFLCWPYFADQFLNQGYIVDHWRVGLGLERDENGIIKQEEIKDKVEKVLSDGSFRTRVLELKEKTIAGVAEGGSSLKNFDKFIDWIKEY